MKLFAYILVLTNVNEYHIAVAYFSRNESAQWH